LQKEEGDVPPVRNLGGGEVLAGGASKKEKHLVSREKEIYLLNRYKKGGETTGGGRWSEGL